MSIIKFYITAVSKRIYVMVSYKASYFKTVTNKPFSDVCQKHPRDVDITATAGFLEFSLSLLNNYCVQ